MSLGLDFFNCKTGYSPQSWTVGKVIREKSGGASLVGSVVKNPPADAGDTGLIRDPGGSHMPQSNWTRAPQLLSLCAGAWELQLLKPTWPRPVLPTNRSHHSEKPTSWNKELPLLGKKSPCRNKNTTQSKIKAVQCSCGAQRRAWLKGQCWEMASTHVGGDHHPSLPSSSLKGEGLRLRFKAQTLKKPNLSPPEVADQWGWVGPGHCS